MKKVVESEAVGQSLVATEVVGVCAAAALFIHMGFNVSPIWCVVIGGAAATCLYAWLVTLPRIAFQVAMRKGTLLSQVDSDGRRVFFLCAHTRGKNLVRRHIKRNRLSSPDRPLTGAL